jgi:hypothetical protein
LRGILLGIERYIKVNNWDKFGAKLEEIKRRIGRKQKQFW